MKIPAFGIPQARADEFAERPLNALRAATADLIEQFQHGRENDTLILSAYMLGEMRSKAAVPSLLAKIEFTARRADNYQLAVTRWNQYPAEEALVKIGSPAVDPIVNALAVEENATRRKLMVHVLCKVLGKDVADFVLKKAADSGTSVGKERFQQSLNDLRTFKP